MARLLARAQALPVGDRPDPGPSPFRSLARLAAERGADPALLRTVDDDLGDHHDGRGVRTWAEVHDGVVRAAAGLVRLGLHPDQVVVTALPPAQAWPDLELAVRATGAVLVHVSPSVPAADVARLLEEVEVRLVVTDGGTAPDPLAGLTLDRALRLDLDGGEGWRRLRQLGAERLVMDPDVVTRTEAMVDPEDTVPRVLVATEDGAAVGRHDAGPVPDAALSPTDVVLLAGSADDPFVRRVLHQHVQLGFALAWVDGDDELPAVLDRVDPTVLALDDPSARLLADRLRDAGPAACAGRACTRLTGVLLAGLPRVPAAVVAAPGVVITELPSAPMGEARLPVRPPVVQGDAAGLPRRMRASRDSAFGAAAGEAVR
jgi:hypothetical protein